MRISLCQLTSTPDPAANLTLVEQGIEAAKEQGSRVVVFPEATMACFGIPLGPVAEPLDGPWATRVREIAAEHGVLIVVGMFRPAEDGRVFNTLLVTGQGIDTHYDKIHLFDAFGFQESRTVAPGTEPLVIDLDGTRLGIATCYDIRFPGLFTSLADRGAQATLLAASWGAGPGKKDQWELLCRARALDSTSWVLACGQAEPETTRGTAPTGIGYSTVATPFGQIHAQAGDKPELLTVDIDLAQTTQAREAIPVLANRRF
ncbi:carbon-nitrogen hydrolase family protein [Pseudonocardiaceae bacterium YIM PH 21723]|nr:carbon-nitrogen hydrolase family protein [Pseudonocardiaceae bacterium YIM PH 21723]